MQIQSSSKEQRNWSVLELIEWSTKYLEDKGFDDPRLNVELLLCHVLKCQRIDLYLKYDMILKPAELSYYRQLFKRRLAHEPLQYILGETNFMGFTITVNPSVLIPRPETEGLVERVIETSKTISKKTIHVLDIGVGSGCIAISIAKYIHNSKIEAIDVSENALEVAKLNIHSHQLEYRISLVHGDFINNQLTFKLAPFDIIVSNPPYISLNEFEELQPEVKNYEPKIANTDFGDGLSFFKVIAKKGKDLLRNDGFVFVEIGYNQKDEVMKIFDEYGYKNIEVFRDYSNIDRVIKAQKE